MTIILPDAEARAEALQLSGSYIVQAPAGSGKTELLTLRYLKLLATCEQPEEVLAITFTRKAASEMRDRIIRILNWSVACRAGKCRPEGSIEELRLSIASKVLQSDERKQWNLLNNPSRFRVQTIDSFCYYLANQLPILSQIGGNANVSENIAPCFRTAIAELLAELESGSALSESISIVLAHLDNDIAAVEQQLLALLGQRDQWSDYIQQVSSEPDSTREYLQQALTELVVESLEEASRLLAEDEAILVTLLNHAAENLARDGKLSQDSSRFLPFATLPPANSESLAAWRFLLNILLTKSGGWLKAANKNHGFPAGDNSDKELLSLCKQRKAERTALIEKYQDNDDLLEALGYIRLLPDPALDSNQWQFLVALCHVLHALSGELLLAFRNHRVVDYTQTGAAALLALGDSEQPTDLAMALDNVIQHILVDEFQDTSRLQLDLLERLTAGWQADDGRTLFLVGDAMQSCYGFRNANVGIYLSVIENGVGDLTLKPLQLSSNFRSQRPVVEWVNCVFKPAFPRQPNISRGAVPYAKAETIHDDELSPGVSVDCIVHDKDESYFAQMAEADMVTEKVLALRREQPGDSIAILVRTRTQLQSIVPALRSAGLQWSASDIDRLGSLPVIEDLMSIVRVVVNPGDRLSWLALLRAPWCGLGVADLFALAHSAEEQDFWQQLRNHQDITTLSSYAQRCLPAFVTVMHFAMEMRFRRSLREVVEASWGLLRGSACCRTSLETDSASRFFDLLAEYESAGGLADLFEFEEAVAKAFVPSPAQNQAGGGLHLLTMHKAKGLEYDHVILPGLSRATRGDDKSLLLWHPRLNAAQQTRLFIAGVSATGSEDSALYQLLRHEHSHKNTLESTRLLYIAVTRARKSASLVATLSRNSKGETNEPRTASLLRRIWRELTNQALLNEIALEDYLANSSLDDTSLLEESYPRKTPIRRFAEPLELTDWETQAIAAQQAAIIEHESPTDSVGHDFDLQSIQGTLIHNALEACVQSSDQKVFLQNLENQHDLWRSQLAHLDLSEDETQSALCFITRSVRETVSNTSLQWVFDPSHDDSHCEYALSRYQEGFLGHYIIDRTFLDQQGTRWIIDYKTARPGSTQSREAFIEEQKAEHGGQLATYRQLMAARGDAPIRTALLLTSIVELVEL